MIVIACIGPVNYLILIGEIEILPSLFQRIIVPASVCEELKRHALRTRCRHGLPNHPFG